MIKTIAILSGGLGWHVVDLQRAAQRLGLTTLPIDFRRLQATLPGSRHSLSEVDAVLVRTMPAGSLEQVVFRMDVLQRARQLGVRVLNPPAALEVCVDKYLALTRLEAADLPIPATMVCQDAESALIAFETLGGDVVVKPIFGAEGRGMMRISDAELAWRTFRTLERSQAILYVQKFIPHPGWDLRAFVIGPRVVAAMRRHAPNSAWRTNVAQGGKAEAVQLDRAEEQMALRAARAVGAPVAGVDLLPLPEGGYAILEVNAVPGWRALAPTSGCDIALEILRYLVADDDAV